MPYTDGLGAAIANPSTLSLRQKIDALKAKRAAMVLKGPFILPPVASVLKSKSDGSPFLPVLKLPSVGPAVVPVSPEVVVTGGTAYPASGGGPVTSGAPSPVMATPQEDSPDAVDVEGASVSGGMSSGVMLLLAGVAVAFLLKKR